MLRLRSYIDASGRCSRRSSWRERFAVAVMAALAVVGGCERGAERERESQREAVKRSEFRDYAAEPIVVEEERGEIAPRMLSTAPNVTELCAALGLADALVGRTRYCTHPPGIERVPAIGALNDLNVEVLLGLRPELILVAGTSRAISERLGTLGLRYVTLPDTSLDDLYTAIERMGELTNRRATAGRLAEAVRADLARVADRFGRGPARRVLIVIGTLPEPPQQVYAAGRGSFYENLLELLGHTNVMPAGSRPFGPASLEFILRADPEVIIELAPELELRPAGDSSAREAWRRVGPLSAVDERRVHVLVGPEHYLLGPRIAHTAAELGALIAGEESRGKDEK